MICDVYLIRSFNEFLQKCHTAFDLNCIHLPTHWHIISDFIKRNADTHQQCLVYECWAVFDHHRTQ